MVFETSIVEVCLWQILSLESQWPKQVKIFFISYHHPMLIYLSLEMVAVFDPCRGPCSPIMLPHHGGLKFEQFIYLDGPTRVLKLGWVWVDLADLTNLVSIPTNSRSKSPCYKQNGQALLDLTESQFVAYSHLFLILGQEQINFSVFNTGTPIRSMVFCDWNMGHTFSY